MYCRPGRRQSYETGGGISVTGNSQSSNSEKPRTGSGGDLVVAYLKVEGVQFVFGVIGSSILDLTDALYREPAIRYVPTQHEQAAAYMADGYARVTGKPGVCIATVGPGVTNLTSGIAQAFVESSPVLALTGDIHTHHYGKGASNFHEIDQQALYRPITKLSKRVEHPERLGEFLQMAFRTAMSGRHGPVYLGLPRDVLRARLPIQVPPPESYRVLNHRVRPDPNQVDRAADLLAAARRPVLILGGGLRWSPGALEVSLSLAETWQIPVVSSLKGLAPEDHPRVFGLIGSTNSPVAMRAVQESDLILAVAHTFSQVATNSYGHKTIPRNPRIVHIDLDATEIGKNYPVVVGLVGDAAAALRDLTQALPATPTHDRREWLAELEQDRADFWAQLAAMAEDDSCPISRMRLLGDLQKVLDRDAIISAEAGATHQWFRFGYRATQPLLEPGGYSVMGSAFCMCMAAKLAYPERQAVAMLGDGAFMMIMPELATAVAQDIPLVVIVCHNDIYGNVQSKQYLNFGGRRIGTDLYIPDLAAIARDFGAYGERVDRPDAIIPALERALSAGRPAVLDVIIDARPEHLEAPTKVRVKDRY
ncbi:MAG: thiamine pyrophosphate-binding protein [Chloroflexi bacterium]|nr:MAG: thiamine pyrophosphate-binding protein [Chloroflexota bacterium]